MLYDVLDISRHIINYSDEKDYGVSNLKLQKLLYFVQAYFMLEKKDHAPCFHEKIEAWDFGPVVPEAYQEWAQYGSCDIPMIESYMVIDKDNIWNSYRVQYHDDVIDEVHEPTGKPVGLIFKINLIGTTCKTDRISLALSE